MTYILLVLGFVFLIKGADMLVDGASSIAKRHRVSNLVIGLTIVAFGTSAPELFVNLSASFNGTTDIAIGNIIGSNISNILLILGISAIIYPLKTGKSTVWREIPFALLASVLLLVVANDVFFDGAMFNALTRTDGIIFIGFFIIFLYYTFGIAKEQESGAVQESPKLYSSLTSIGLIVGGMIGLALGGQWIVTSATTIALHFGLSDALIGLTVVAIGTSLPELATSAVAAYKKNTDIAIGNIVGSNIFNVFWILGLSSIIAPLSFSSKLNFDLWVAVAASALLSVFMFIGKRYVIERWQGVICVLLYVAYIVVIVVRG